VLDSAHSILDEKYENRRVTVLHIAALTASPQAELEADEAKAKAAASAMAMVEVGSGV